MVYQRRIWVPACSKSGSRARGKGRAAAIGLVVYRQGDKAIVVYGFKKSDADNIADDELAFFRELAASLLALSEQQIAVAIESEELYEIEEDADER